jgi:hypothetical protein
MFVVQVLNNEETADRVNERVLLGGVVVDSVWVPAVVADGMLHFYHRGGRSLTLHFYNNNSNQTRRKEVTRFILQSATEFNFESFRIDHLDKLLLEVITHHDDLHLCEFVDHHPEDREGAPNKVARVNDVNSVASPSEISLRT